MKKSFFFGGLLFLASFMMAQNTIDNAFFEKVKFRGAMGTTDWTNGWSNFDPQTTVYPATDVTIPAGTISANTTWGSPVRCAASFTDAPVNNAFFTPVDYVGAFGKTDWTSGWSNFDPQSTVYPATNVTIPAGNLATTTWTSNNVYLLNGFVYIPDGVTLTIEPGTVIRGDKTNKGTIIVEKGGKLIANGTASEPIVFTSNVAAGDRTYGDWGGIILLGKAPINVTGGSTTIEGGVGRSYGGSDAGDNSGSLQYVRIEFPGIAFELNNEINGLTMGGVGSGTTIDNVQVSFSGDDSFEWFGGTVNAKHLIALRGWDDDFDTDFGYSGMVQFGVSLRDPNIADTSTSNCFESDNDGTGSNNTPFTTAVFSNISSFGPLVTPSTTIHSKYGRAIHYKKNTKLQVLNSVLAGWPTGIVVETTGAQTSATNGELKLRNTVLSGMTANAGIIGSGWDLPTATAWVNTASYSNTILTDNASLDLVNPFSLTAPNFRPVTHTYKLDGFVYIADGATLKIPAGTVIRGDKTNKGTIIVEKGGKLIANGTVSEPIVFTSNVAAGDRTYGDWGGIILLGKAPINVTGGSTTIEGGVGRAYGGSDPTDNSGSLQYVRIEFPGIAFELNNEINGLTMGGVGSGTTIDNVQVSYSGDDSFEWFGGTVNAKHLIALRGWDDDFDTDFGYSGMVQFGVSLRDPNIADTSTSNCFESDNDGTGSNNTPFTTAVFSNISSFGPLVTPSTTIHSKYGRAIHYKKNTKLQVLNSVLAGWPTGIVVETTGAQTSATNGELKLRNTVLSGMTANAGIIGSGWDLPTATAWVNTASYLNKLFVSNSDLEISNPFSLTAPDFQPTATSTINYMSYWNMKSETGFAYNMKITATGYANGSQITTAGSMLLSYKNGVCNGSVEVNNGRFIMTVGSNVASDTDLDLKLYDAATRKLYHLPSSFDFTASGTYGSIPVPVQLDATSSLTIPLIKNSNWISFNVVPENKSLANVLNYNANNNDFISSQSETSTYYDGVWYGMEESGIEKNKMYVLICGNTTPGSIQITHQPVVKNTPVSIQAGYNWIGYSLKNAYDIHTAMPGINVADGDYIITSAEKGGSAEYYQGVWYGSGANYMMNPGVGYVLKATSSSTFSFPTNTLNSAVKVKAATNATAKAFTSEVGQRYAMPIFAQVYDNDALFQPAGLQIGVFKDGVCYGTTGLTNGPNGKLHIVTVGSNSETLEGLTYKVFDPTSSKYYDVVESVNFASLSPVGKVNAPVALHIKAQTSIGEKANEFSVYPNQIESTFNVTFNATTSTNASVVLYDMQGRFVKSLFNGEVNGNKSLTVQRENYMNNGLYLVKASVGDKQFTQKIVLK